MTSNIGLVHKVYYDFLKRRIGLVKALTTDRQQLLKALDPEEDMLCLYGLPDGTWEVKKPKVPPELPEPHRGVNFAIFDTDKREWVKLVATYCDSWLVAMASFAGASSLSKDDKARLLREIGKVPTVLDAALEYFDAEENV